MISLRFIAESEKSLSSSHVFLRKYCSNGVRINYFRVKREIKIKIKTISGQALIFETIGYEVLAFFFINGCERRAALGAV